MLYQPTLTPAALPATRATVRAHLRVHLPQAPADDSSLDAAIAAALRDWDTADPLIWYYRPYSHTVTLHPSYTLTDAYYDPGTADPRPDPAHAADYTTDPASPNTITLDPATYPDPARILLRLVIPRQISPLTSITVQAITLPAGLPASAVASANLNQLTLHNPPNTWFDASWSTGQKILIHAGASTVYPGLYTAGSPINQLIKDTTLALWRPVGRANRWYWAVNKNPYNPIYTFAPAPPALTNVSDLEAERQIAPRAAAYIILGRTEDKHPAADWAARALAAPWPAPRDATSHAILPRADYL